MNTNNNMVPSKILSAAADGAVGLFARNGGDVEKIFAAAGVRVNDLAGPVAEVNLAQYCALFELASHSTHNHNIGLHFGNSFQPKQLGMLGYTAISSPTLAAALRNMELYFSAHQNQTSFGLIPDDGIIWLSYKIFDPRIVDRRQDAELSLGMFCNIFKSALGNNWRPLEVRFEHEKPDNINDHERLFGSPIVFGRRTNAVGFHHRDLDAIMPKQDPYLFAVVTAFLEGRLKLQSNPVDFSQIVRNEIKMHLGTRLPTMQEISNVLGISDHALQKKLRSHGLNFTDIVKAARHELALHYMNDANLPLTEVAYSLGYSELSSFSRAFRNWTGMNPQRYRRLGGD